MITKLQDRYLLVSLNSRQPAVTKKSDKAKAAAVKDMLTKGVDAVTADKIAKAQIELWPNKEISDVMTPYHSFNTYHRRVTIDYLPGKGMPKLLSIHKQQEHSDKFYALKLAHEQCKADFIGRYSKIMESIESHCGEYFDPANYPSKDAVANAFEFSVQYMPLADPSAFELGAFTVEQSTELKKQLNATVQKAADNATREYRDRLRDSVQHIASKLRGGKGTRLHGSLLTNLEELLDADLNVSADPELQTVIDSVKLDTSTIKRAIRTRCDSDKGIAANKAEAIDRKLAALF